MILQPKRKFVNHAERNKGAVSLILKKVQEVLDAAIANPDEQEIRIEISTAQKGVRDFRVLAGPHTRLT